MQKTITRITISIKGHYHIAMGMLRGSENMIRKIQIRI
jgi:hypothetical protein